MISLRKATRGYLGLSALSVSTDGLLGFTPSPIAVPTRPLKTSNRKKKQKVFFDEELVLLLFDSKY